MHRTPQQICNPDLETLRDPNEEVPLARDVEAVPTVVVVQRLVRHRGEESVRLMRVQRPQRRRRQQRVHTGERDDTTICELLIVQAHAGRAEELADHPHVGLADVLAHRHDVPCRSREHRLLHPLGLSSEPPESTHGVFPDLVELIGVLEARDRPPEIQQ